MDNSYPICDAETLAMYLQTAKANIVRFLNSNFKEGIHYTKRKNQIPKKEGNNRMIFRINQDTMELTKSSYNIRYKYVEKIGNLEQVSTIIMSVENKTIEFIMKVYQDIFEMHRQYRFGTYFVDLYIPKLKLVIECDENNHVDRDATFEEKRTRYIENQGCKFVRYNPNDDSFKIELVLNQINKHFMKNSV